MLLFARLKIDLLVLFSVLPHSIRASYKIEVGPVSVTRINTSIMALKLSAGDLWCNKLVR